MADLKRSAEIKLKTIGLAVAVLTLAVLLILGCRPAIYAAAGKYRLVDHDSIYLNVESNGRVISNAFERAEQREYTWYETPDDHEISICPKDPNPKIPYGLIVRQDGDYIIIRFEGDDFRFRKIK